jgi:hypothetical protein
VAGAPWWEDFRALEGEARTDTGTTTPTVARTVEAPPVVHRPPRPPRGLQVTTAVLVVVLLALLALLAVRTLGSGREGTAGESGTPSGPPTTPVVTASASSGGGTAAADSAALASLNALREQGLAAHPIEGQWVAQLSAKSVGTTDPVQTAANGSSTFYPADILAQSQEIASGIAGGDVFVLQTTDFGDALVDARGNPYWVTLAAGPFAQAGDVQAWCDSMFASTPADVRGNVCLPRRLTPPDRVG